MPQPRSLSCTPPIRNHNKVHVTVAFSLARISRNPNVYSEMNAIRMDYVLRDETLSQVVSSELSAERPEVLIWNMFDAPVYLYCNGDNILAAGHGTMTLPVVGFAVLATRAIAELGSNEDRIVPLGCYGNMHLQRNGEQVILSVPANGKKKEICYDACRTSFAAFSKRIRTEFEEAAPVLKENPEWEKLFLDPAHP